MATFFRKILLFSFVFLFGAAAVYAAPSLQFELDGETLEIPTDGRKWEKGFDHDAGNKGVVEYVLPGEIVESWSELVTVNYFKGMTEAGKVDQLVAFTKNGLTQVCQNTVWNVLSHKNNNTVYEWSVQGCKQAPDQSEIARVFQGKAGLYVLHYANKKVPMPDQNRAAWVSLLSKANLKKSS